MCEYYAHEDCKDFAVNDCLETATYVPTKDNVSQISLTNEYICQKRWLKYTDYFLFLFSQQHPYDIIIIGAKEIYPRIPNVPYVEKHVGQVNVLLACVANGVE